MRIPHGEMLVRGALLEEEEKAMSLLAREHENLDALGKARTLGLLQ